MRLDKPLLRWFEYLYRSLLLVRGYVKLIQCLGVKLDHPVPGGYKYEDLAIQVEEVPNLRE
jgi:hypothetical protein